MNDADLKRVPRLVPLAIAAAREAMRHAGWLDDVAPKTSPTEPDTDVFKPLEPAQRIDGFQDLYKRAFLTKSHF